MRRWILHLRPLWDSSPGTSPDAEEIAARVSLFALAGTLFWSTALSELAAGLFIIIAAARLIRDRGMAFRPRWVSAHALVSLSLLLLALYVVGVLISAAVSPFSREFETYARLWHVLLFPAAVILRPPLEILKRAGGVFALSGTTAALAAILGYFAGTSPHLNALFLGNTTLADMLVIVAVVLFGSMIAPPEFRILPLKSWHLMLVAVPSIVAVFLSALRGPVGVLIAAIAALTLVHRPRALVVQAMALGALIMISPLELWMKFAWLAEGHTIDRYVLWKAGLDLLPKIPLFGFGPGSYERILPPETWAAFANRPPASWHNDFLATVLESGWHTAVAYTACLALLIAGGTVAWFRRRSAMHGPVAGMLACALSLLIFFSLLSTVVATATLGIVLWTITGLLASALSGGDLDEHVPA